jgi:hypothetical protein
MEARRETGLKDAAWNQLVYDLSTAQSQRRALGLDQQILFGGVFIEGVLTIFSSFGGKVSTNSSAS